MCFPHEECQNGYQRTTFVIAIGSWELYLFI